MLEQDFEFLCPYCGEALTVQLDLTGGERQAFIYDCEVCCQPIQIQFEVSDQKIQNFTATSSD